MSDAWYVIQVRPRCEAEVAGYLEDEAFEVFAPEYLKVVTHARRRVRVPAPLFPCYVFVRFDVADQARWKPINRVVGVVHVLTSVEENPMAVPDELIAELQNSMNVAGYMDVTDETKPIRYRPGQFLRIVDGTFQGFIGLYIASDNQRVSVLLDILGGARPVHVPGDQVVLADQPPGRQRRSRAPFQRARRAGEPAG